MRRAILAIILTVTTCLLFLPTESRAMPNFARKYNASCDMCHTVVPKLTRVGYEFRLAGYRLPDEIGKDEKPFNLGDFFTARFQVQYKWDRKTPAAGSRTTSSQLEFFEFTLYPLAGSWGRNFASLGEFSMAPDDVFETENAFVRYDTNLGKGIFQSRVGIMHPFEGFGASDRPLSISRPLIQKSKGSGNPFIVWNLDQAGIEAGYYFMPTGTAISANVWNGVIWKEDGSGNAEPAQGGGLAKRQGEPGANDKDFQVVLTQLLPNETGATLYYYRGVIPFPNPTTTPPPATLTRDTFHRLNLYGNYWVLPKTVNLEAGIGYGSDSLGNSGVPGGSTVGKSKGYFVEADYHLNLNDLGVAARYDYFDPSDKATNNLQRAYTVAVNLPSTIGLQGIGEYQHKVTDKTATGQEKEDIVTARLIFIW